MNAYDNIPTAKQETLQRTVDALKNVEGVAAVVLGGSYARGTHNAGSDIDLGIYYFPSSPFSIEAIRQIALELSQDSQPVVTAFYEWGPWVNGGAWIKTASGKMDFIYRNIEQVERTIQEASDGIWHHHYDQQPTFGFYSVIYLAETHVSVPLWDPESIITRLKQSVQEYPPRLQQKITVDMLWGSEFTLMFAQKYAAAGDIYNTVGCFARIAGYLTQALYALNAEYYISDKKVLDAIETFAKCPENYSERLNQILANPGATGEELTRSVNRLRAVWQDTVELAGDMYQPRFILDNLKKA